jgi:hypothetical protein
MLAYKPAPTKILAQAAAPAIAPSVAPVPVTDMLFTGYTGIPGMVEALLVLGATGAAAWVGIRTGMKEKDNKTLKAAGWIGGIGSALMGVLYIGAKSGLNMRVGIPAFRVTPV